MQAQFPPFVEEEQEDSLAACSPVIDDADDGDYDDGIEDDDEVEMSPDMNVFWLREAAGKLA